MSEELKCFLALGFFYLMMGTIGFLCSYFNKDSDIDWKATFRNKKLTPSKSFIEHQRTLKKLAGYGVFFDDTPTEYYKELHKYKKKGVGTGNAGKQKGGFYHSGKRYRNITHYNLEHDTDYYDEYDLTG